MIVDINHVNIVTAKLDETRDFFVNVLGLTEGDRPDVGFPGYWLYAGDKAVMHLQSRDFSPEGRGPSGPLDHAAFDVSDLAAAKDRLNAAGVPFFEAVVRPGWAQLFLKDPNGVRIELGGAI